MGELLSRAYPALDWLSRRFPRAMESHGVGVPFVPDAAAHTRLTAGAGYGALPILFNAPMMILGGLGVATQGGVSPGVNVLWGEQAWAFSDEAITDLLSKGLWLDARAASILIERGFGRHIGIKPGRWLDRESALYALERFMHSHTGVRRGFNASVNLAPRLLTFEAVAGAETWTEIVDCMNRRLGAGLCVFNNAKGGRVAVTAYNLANNGIAYRNWYLGFQRQTLVHRLVGALAGRSVPVMAEGAPHALTIEQRLDADRAVVVINGWPDPIAAGSMRVNIPGAKRVRESVLIAPLRAPRRIPARTSRSGNGLAVMPGADMPYLGMWVLRAG